MFAYCNNNSVNCVDNTGTDAVWIQEEGRVNGKGHSGLLVDDGEGNWYFLYWGSAGDPSWPQIIFGAPYKFVFVKIDVSECDLSSAEGVALALKNSDNSTAQTRSQYVTGVVYLEGDYSETYKYLADKYEQELSKPGSLKKYKLLTNNCAQVTWKALEQSCSFFRKYNCSIIPNDTFETVKSIDKLIDRLLEILKEKHS